MSDWGPDEWFHAAPTELAETVVGCGSYKHAAPTELGCPGDASAINMPLLTKLSGATRWA